jgi:hypothetical protein
MAVANGNHGVASVEVEILPALVVPHPAAFALDNVYVEELINIE